MNHPPPEPAPVMWHVIVHSGQESTAYLVASHTAATAAAEAADRHRAAGDAEPDGIDVARWTS